MSQEIESLDFRPAPVFLPLWRSKARYKGAWGGRASGKSHDRAEHLIISCLQGHTRAVCLREVQNSIKDSVKQLLEDKIRDLGQESLFDVVENEIRGPHDSLIIFKGLQSYNSHNVKSLEGFGIGWVEESQTISQRSLDILCPTFRSNSELWFTWNPDQPEDAIDRFLRQDPPDNSEVVYATYMDNPKFPEELLPDVERDKRLSPDRYGHIWLGEYLTISEQIVLSGKYRIDTFESQPDWDGPYFGADWGFAQDPTTLVKCWVHNNKLYIERECGGVGVELDDTPALFDTVQGSRNHLIRGDCARPETIAFLNRRGFRIEGVKKWSGSVEDGVEFIRSFDEIVIHDRCKGTQKEARTYSYKMNRGGDILPLIEDKNNHYIDAIRYALQPLIQKRDWATQIKFPMAM